MDIEADYYGGFVPHVFYILAHHQNESCSSYDNMNRLVMEAKVKVMEVTGVTGPEGMPLLKYSLNFLLFHLVVPLTGGHTIRPECHVTRRRRGKGINHTSILYTITFSGSGFFFNA
jgi:hypothetical protein